MNFRSYLIIFTVLHLRNRLHGSHEKMLEYSFCVLQKKEDYYIFYWIRWQQIISSEYSFCAWRKKEDSDVNRIPLFVNRPYTLSVKVFAVPYLCTKEI